MMEGIARLTAFEGAPDGASMPAAFREPSASGLRTAAAKAGLRSGLGRFFNSIGVLDTAERAAKNRLAVLCYHRILPAPLRLAYHDPNLAITPDIFANQCETLRQHYTVVPLGEALRRWQQGESPSKPFASITFDDGYQDNIEFAVPILNDLSLRATFFVIAGLVGTSDPPWYDRAGAAWTKLARANRAPTNSDACEAVAQAKTLTDVSRKVWLDGLTTQAGPLAFAERDRIMTEQQVQALLEAGHEIGSHSMTHPLLPQCDDAALETEVTASRLRLAAITGMPISGMCYPNGDNNARVREQTRHAGYAYGASVESGLNDHDGFDPMAIKRWFIDQAQLTDAFGHHSEALFRAKVCGLTQSMRQWRLFR